MAEPMLLTGLFLGPGASVEVDPSAGWVYLCRNLVSKRDRGKVTFAKVLKDNGIKPRTEIDVRVQDGRWHI